MTVCDRCKNVRGNEATVREIVISMPTHLFGKETYSSNRRELCEDCIRAFIENFKKFMVFYEK